MRFLFFALFITLFLSPVTYAQDLTDFVSDEDQSGSEEFILDADGTAGAGDLVTIRFGAIILESLSWDVDNNYFFLSDALVVDGNVNVQGTTLRIDSDETGNPDQDLDIIAEQGTEPDGVLRYDDGNNRWEISNNGGPFAAISTVGGASSDFEGVYTTDADKVLTTSNGNFTINSGTGTFNVTGATNLNVSNNRATSINTGTSTGAVSIGGNANTVAIDSSSWDISSAGVATGLTGITSTGAINFTGASSFRGRQGASDPVTCTVGEEFYNTTSNTKKLCLATNSWSPVRTGFFGTEYFYTDDDSVSTMTSTTFAQKLRLTTGSLPAGTYRIGWSYQWNHDSTSDEFEARIQIDDSTEIQYHQQEPQDSAGTFGSTGTDQKHTSSGFKHISLSSGVHFIDIDYRTNVGGVESSIWNTRLEIWRVQ